MLERLEHEEQDNERPRLARTYRRLIELSRSDDEVDAVLAAHLVRELLFVLPVSASVPVEPGHMDYKSYAETIAESWPSGARGKPIPRETVDKVRSLLEEHERRRGAPRSDPTRSSDAVTRAVLPMFRMSRWCAGADFQLKDPTSRTAFEPWGTTCRSRTRSADSSTN